MQNAVNARELCPQGHGPCAVSPELGLCLGLQTAKWGSVADPGPDPCVEFADDTDDPSVAVCSELAGGECSNSDQKDRAPMNSDLRSFFPPSLSSGAAAECQYFILCTMDLQ